MKVLRMSKRKNNKPLQGVYLSIDQGASPGFLPEIQPEGDDIAR